MALIGCQDAAVSSIAGIGPIGTIRKVVSGHEFTEGPTVDAKGNIYFSDLNEEKVFRVMANGSESTFIEESRRANGLMFDATRNRILACESGAGAEPGIARIVAFGLDDGSLEVVVPGYGGQPFNRVNDLVIDRQGGIYFSDILGGEPELPQEAAAVYYATRDGTVSRVITGLDRPNGVLLSPDEETLYVLPYGSVTLMSYDVVAPGVLGVGRVLTALPKSEDNPRAGGDGMTVDSEGNLYVALPASMAIVVISPKGEILGSIPIPEAPSNAIFGGPDRKTLYVTARTSLYAIPMEATGHTFGEVPSQVPKESQRIDHDSAE